MKPSIILAALALLLTHAPAQSVFINELHYDNTSTDANEGVEIAGPAGTDLSNYKLVLYNGSNGTSYGDILLGGILPSQNGTASGTAFFAKSAIQNGGPDGIALIDTVANSVVQFLSYEGTFTATDGEAAGEISTDIGVNETGSTPVGQSLQLTGSGSVYSDFAWQSPSASSPGMINSGQTFLGAGDPNITLTLMPSTIREGTTSTATVSLFPAPPEPVQVTLQNSDPTELNIPPSITVTTSGSATFTVTAIDDQLNDGAQTATITASAPLYDPAIANALIQDIQRPNRGSAIRLATINTLNGIGAPGSEEYNALATLIDRLEPDIISFQEVSSAGDFFDLRQLLDDLGFPHLAIEDDALTAQPYEGGRFTTNQNLAIASHFPITSTTQIERGQTDRKEVTRYPLMAEVDVPGTDNDPVVVAVHYKASTDDASRYRKAVEAYRTIQGIITAGHDPTTDNIFVLGDVNEDHDRFMPGFYNTGNTNFADGTNLPVTFDLGSDLSGANATPIPYAQFPDRIFAESNFVTPYHLHQDGRTERTFITLGDAALDYIIHSDRVAANAPPRTEIYNSSLDNAFDGMTKQGNPAPPGTSFIATDHFAIIGDYHLEPTPALTVRILINNFDENSENATGTVTRPEPATTPLAVSLSVDRPGSPISLPTSPVNFAAGETTKNFPIDILDLPTSDPDRTITVYASAEGHAPGGDDITIHNLDPDGDLLFSQYTEPPTGSTPRSIELFNCRTTPINFAHEPLHIIQYTNGSTSGNVTARAETGILPPGNVVVIGDPATGDYLVSQGLIPTPAEPFSTAENGTAYSNAAGEVVFVKDLFQFNGDDALEIRFAYTLNDIFGNIGQDPGTAWVSNNVTTTGRNLSLIDNIAIPSAGFTQPHLRFTDTAPGNDLTGFGIPPAASDPFKTWLLSFGLTDPQSDPDQDGSSNLLEYATGTDPTSATSSNTPTLTSTTFTHRQLVTPGRLTYTVESSQDLKTWTSENLSINTVTPNGDGTETIEFQLTSPPRIFHRLKVTLD